MLNEARTAEVVELCRRFIRQPSLSGHEGAMAGLVREAMEAMGYDEVRVDSYGNVVGRIRLKKPGRKILFEAHMDHVDVTDRSRWSVDPYGAEIRDGKIYGRAASDMKGSLASMIAAASYLKQDHYEDLAGEVLVAGSVHEECFEGVACREISEIYRPDFVVIGEASSLNVKRGQRGRAEILLEVVGKSAHSSNPQEGINAVKKMMAVLRTIEAGYVAPEHAVLGKGILELTDIISHPYPGASVVPERCRVTFDRRLLVGETEDSVLKAIRDLIEEAVREDPKIKASVSIAIGRDRCYTGKGIEAKRFAPGWLLDENHELVEKALMGLKSVGLSPELSHYAFCTNGSYYAGIAGIPTIGFGPSREELAHVVDEYVEISQLRGATEGYYAIAKEVLK